MLTAMTEEDWTIVLRVFAASRSRRGDVDLVLTKRGLGGSGGQG
jgi:hypothetical protein